MTTDGRLGETERLDRVFDCLADEQRRQTMEFLCERGAPVSVTELAIHLARQDANEAVIGADCPRVQRRRQRLYHVHLPKLAAAELVTFDTETETVALVDELPVQPRSWMRPR